jgi:hypothetical protein
MKLFEGVSKADKDRAAHNSILNPSEVIQESTTLLNEMESNLL